MGGRKLKGCIWRREGLNDREAFSRIYHKIHFTRGILQWTFESYNDTVGQRCIVINN